MARLFNMGVHHWSKWFHQYFQVIFLIVIHLAEPVHKHMGLHGEHAQEGEAYASAAVSRKVGCQFDENDQDFYHEHEAEVRECAFLEAERGASVLIKKRGRGKQGQEVKHLDEYSSQNKLNGVGLVRSWELAYHQEDRHGLDSTQ